MTESEAKRMVKRKNDLPGHKAGSDGWIYQAAAKSGFPGGWVVERRRRDGHGFSIFKSSAN